MNSDNAARDSASHEPAIPGQMFGLWLLAGTMMFLALLILGDLLASLLR